MDCYLEFEMLYLSRSGHFGPLPSRDEYDVEFKTYCSIILPHVNNSLSFDKIGNEHI